MRRLRFLAGFILVFIVASVPGWAQHGGGHAGGAAHGSFGGHSFSAHPGGTHSSGMHSGPSAGSHSFSRNSAVRGPSGRGNRRGGVNLRTYGARNNCIGYGCRGRYRNPFGYAGYYDPYWWWDSGSSYDGDREREIGLANEMNQESLDQQRAREQGDQDNYARRDPQTPGEAERTETAPATVLVFRDQHKQEIQNYAIVGQTLWNFAPQRTEKIPLADLDLSATTKANDERGVNFKVPAAGEGQ